MPPVALADGIGFFRQIEGFRCLARLEKRDGSFIEGIKVRCLGRNDRC
jgi:hypothetical protein